MIEIPIYKPELPPYDKIESDLRDMYASGKLYPSKYTAKLEDRLAADMDVRHVQAVASCSLGLMMLLSYLREGSEVIIPAFTFNATLQAVEWNNLVPVVVDVDENGQLDPRMVNSYLFDHGGRERVSAVMPVHMWGNACYPEEFEQLGREYGVKIFYDGAHVLGTKFKGQHISRYGDATVHSIAATKPISAGEGGIFITNNTTLSEHFADVGAHGMFGTLDTRVKGTNGKIQEFNSILALHALDMFDKTKSRRTYLMKRYDHLLSRLPVRVWKTREHVEACYKDCTIFVENHRVRQDLETYLNKNGIGTKRYFDPPVPEMGSFRGKVSPDGYPVSKQLSQTCLNLPLYPALTDQEQTYIADMVGNFFSR